MDNIELNEYQKHLLSMLEVFTKYCDENNITYFLAGGSLIGAIRHKGFIPWDDDIDIAIPRPDFMRLVSLKGMGLPQNYTINYGCKTSDFVFTYAKFVDTNTTLVQTNHNIKYGLYLDIFPIDGCGNTFSGFKKNYRHFYFLLGLLNNNQYTDRRKGFFRRGFQLVAQKCDREKLFGRMEKVCTRYSFEESEYVAIYASTYQTKEFSPKKWFSNTKTAKFNGLDVKIPAGYDEYLTQIYGDYMTPPPDSERMGHDRAVVQLDTPYKMNMTE